MLKKVFDLFGHGSTAWALLPVGWQAAITTALSAVTGYFGYETGGVFYALVGAAAMFAFGMAGAYFALRLHRMNSVFERLTVEAIAVVQAGIMGNKEKTEFAIRYLTLECHLRNTSERTMFMQIRRANHSMAGVTVPGPAKHSSEISIIPPGVLQKIVMATLPDIKIGGGELSGHLEFEFLYGSARDSLRYMLLYQGEPKLSLLLNTEAGGGELTIQTLIIKHLHERA
jgi:hypothetical protein